MNGFQRIRKLGHLASNDRHQRALLGTVLLVLSFWRTRWGSAVVADYIATLIQLDLIITGLLGWCPLVAYQTHRTKNKTI